MQPKRSQELRLGKRGSLFPPSNKLDSSSLEQLERFYQVHIKNLSLLNSPNRRSIIQSFNKYINFVFNILDLHPQPEKPQNVLLKRIKTDSEVALELLLAESKPRTVASIKHPMDPKAPSMEDFGELVESSSDFKIFRIVLLKIMCNETIEMSDLEKFSEGKLFNLKKIVFVKFKRVIDTELVKKTIEFAAETTD